jgi:pimeloyl-ACP methyl ester carboxylesterase
VNNPGAGGTALRVREYGTSGPLVVLLHGGPGAPGYLAPVAQELAASFRVLEPFQRGRGAEPLTVARHVADLHELLAGAGGGPPALVGHSWGAMLALAYAAAHPGRVASLALVGCGTFDEAARERLRALYEGRLDAGLRRRLDGLAEEYPDPDQRLRALGRLLLRPYSYDVAGEELEVEACDARAHRETWEDMVRLQERGVYPAAFAAISEPVLMLHGAVDPHPGALVRAGLEPYLPQLEYHEWARCGHYPWLEKAVREEFFAVLRQWLARHSPRA